MHSTRDSTGEAARALGTVSAKAAHSELDATRRRVAAGGGACRWTHARRHHTKERFVKERFVKERFVEERGSSRRLFTTAHKRVAA